MSQPRPLLSEEMLATADAIRNVRSRLYHMVRDGHYPHGAMPDITTIQVLGLDVADAMVRLAAEVPPQRTPTPYDPDERR